jgi:hypothetical protein
MKKTFFLLVLIPVMAWSQNKVESYGRLPYKRDTIQMTRMEISGYFMEKAGANFTASGVLLLAGVGIGCVPLIKTDINSDVVTYFAIGAGAMWLGSVIELIIAGQQVKRAGLVLKETTKYKVEEPLTGYE